MRSGPEDVAAVGAEGLGAEAEGQERVWLRPAQKKGRQFLNPVPTEVGGLRMALRLLPLYFANRAERTPEVPVGPFRTDPAKYAAAPRTGLRVTWFGHSASLVEMDGVRVLIDPVWEQRASPWQRLGPKRFFAPTLPLADLPEVDVVLLSHDHYDHLGEHTVRALAGMAQTRRATWVTSVGVGALLLRWGVDGGRLREMDWTDRVEVRSERTGASLEVTALPSRHFSGRSLRNRYQTLWGCFVLAGREHRVLYGADSGWWPGFGEIGREFGPFDLVMLEIGAFHELWASIHLGPDGAARAFEEIGGSGLLMPIHWGLFDLALHPWRQPIERMEAVAREKGIVLWSPEPGLPTEVVPGEGVMSGWWRRKEVGV